MFHTALALRADTSSEVDAPQFLRIHPPASLLHGADASLLRSQARYEPSTGASSKKHVDKTCFYFFLITSLSNMFDNKSTQMSHAFSHFYRANDWLLSTHSFVVNNGTVSLNHLLAVRTSCVFCGFCRFYFLLINSSLFTLHSQSFASICEVRSNSE